jgi:AAA+ ATPase superfamily predicted ATPase
MRGNPFASFRSAFEFVFEYAKQEQVIFVIDEYPYLAGSDKAVSSILQSAIDRHQHDSRLFLILCGSSMSFLENQVLGYKSPLYGRRTSQYKLLPFDYMESAEMTPTFSKEEKIILYSITGGIPEYLSRIDYRLSVRENLQALFFSPAGRMFEEPVNLLKQELKFPDTYSAIITAIADGSSRLNEIASKAGIETSQCSKMLSSLSSLGLVVKECPVTEPNSKKTIYQLSDWMFVFWYRFVRPDLSRITAGFGEEVCDELLGGKLSSHVGRAFEDCVKQFMWHSMKEKTLPLNFIRIGRWWGNNPKERCEEEIDFIAFSDQKAIFGESKWRNEKVGISELSNLARKSGLFTEFTEYYYMLFSKTGFTATLKRTAEEQKNVILTDLGCML